jgi:hypothetical protein
MMGNSAARPEGAIARAPIWVPALMFLLMLAPLALTPLVPAVDFNDHVLRYWILADNGQTQALADNYTPVWSLIPNLGMDVLGTGLLKIMAPMPAGRIIAMLVLLAPFAGALALARAVQGRITLFTCFIAGFLGFSHIFGWGFANYLLGTGLMLLGLAWWIAMKDRPWLQLAGAILLGAVLMIVHALAFAVFGLMLGMVELALAFAAGWPGLGNLVVRGARLVSVAILPVFIFLSSRTAEAPQGVTAAVSNLGAYREKQGLFARLFEEALSRADLLTRFADSFNPWADRAIGLGLWAIVLTGLLAGALRLAPALRLAAALALLLVLVLPPNLFGSGYTNDRMPLLLWSMLVGALVLNPGHRLARPLTVAAGLLFAAHLSLVAASYQRAGAHFRAFMAQTTTIELGPLATPLHFSGSGRSDNLPYCSGLLPLLAFTKGMAVPTFAFPTQQPLELDGPLKAAGATKAELSPRKDRLKDRDLTDVGERQDRIARQFGFGYTAVVVCDAAGPVPSDARIERVAAGPFWAVYREQAGDMPEAAVGGSTE